MSVEVASPLGAVATDSHADSLDLSSTAVDTLDTLDPQGSQDPGTDLSLDGGPSSDPLSQPAPALSPKDDVDFLLHPVELAKGRRAAENYLSSFRSDDSRKMAEEALETLATVISGGKCDSVEFPWQQVRPYHGAAALTILKEKGAPQRIESLRCRNDTTRSYRVVPDAYPTRQVQKIRSTLSKVIEQCCELGFVGDSLSDDLDADSASAPSTSKSTKKTPTKGTKKTAKSAPKKTPAHARLLADGELRALVAASAASGNAEGRRDSVLFSLAYRGLKIAEITGLTQESIRFSNKTGACTIVAGPTRGAGRGRRVELTNDEMIGLEDWLEHRGDGKGPLLCTLGRSGQFEGKRLTTAMLKEICERRAQQAEVAAFTPNDLSRSAESLTEHRKNARRRANKIAQESPSTADRVLFDSAATSDGADQAEAIQFPFLGLTL